MCSAAKNVTRRCHNSPDTFCYICGEFTLKSQRRNISGFVKKVYLAYFKIKLGDQDKIWAPHIVCRMCVEGLRSWFKGNKKCFRFGIPMIWREQANHTNDCYFCSVDVTGFNKRNRKEITYPNMISAIRPVPHNSDIPVPEAPNNLEEVVMQGETQSTHDYSDSDFTADDRPEMFSQEKLNDLIRNLGLSKDGAQLLGYTLKKMNLLACGVSYSWYRHRERDYASYFTAEETILYCSNVHGLMKQVGIEYDPSQWRLFIDSNKCSLKAVLLHNWNEFASLPVAHSVTLKEKYNDLALILKKIKYEDHGWMICGDLKVIGTLLGQQAGNTKYPCFLCMWDSRDRCRHWNKVDWPPRNTLTVGSNNINNVNLVPCDRIILPPLHIKLGLMKQFCKSL